MGGEGSFDDFLAVPGLPSIPTIRNTTPRSGPGSKLGLDGGTGGTLHWRPLGGNLIFPCGLDWAAMGCAGSMVWYSTVPRFHSPPTTSHRRELSFTLAGGLSIAHHRINKGNNTQPSTSQHSKSFHRFCDCRCNSFFIPRKAAQETRGS